MPGIPTSPLLALAGLLAVACGAAVVLLVRERRSTGKSSQRLARRNAEIARLRQQLLDARRLEAVGVLAGGIVNNLNNLLSAMLGSARLASHEADLSASARQELDRLLKAGHQAADLVRELGDFYRDADQARRPQDLLPVARDTVKLLQDIVPTTVEVRADLHQCGPVLSTRAGVQQTIMSLGSAAVQALGSTGGRITIRLDEQRLEHAREAAKATLAPGAYARLGFEVESAERGAKLPIEEAALAALCHQVEDQGTLVVPAAGKPDRHVCEVWFPLIAWRVAAGTETAITTVSGALPRPLEPEPAEPEVPAANGPPRATILLVDDEEMVAQVLARGLRRLGYRVVTHLDARTALTDFSQTPQLFDIVITDQIMPQMSGVRLAQRIHEVRPDIPVALCTGFRDSFNEQQAREAGVADFILKPTSHRALAAVVDRHVLKRMEGRG
ncbi:MAG: response regulator [bacterium]|nr:response regulator [bacterium]